jgi:multidrug transporter EmrE-like cation transporter
MIVNFGFSVIIVFTSFLKEVPVIDIATFYATAFGAGASVAAVVASMMYKRKLDGK